MENRYSSVACRPAIRLKEDGASANRVATEKEYDKPMLLCLSPSRQKQYGEVGESGIKTLRQTLLKHSVQQICKAQEGHAAVPEVKADTPCARLQRPSCGLTCFRCLKIAKYRL